MIRSRVVTILLSLKKTIATSLVALIPSLSMGQPPATKQYFAGFKTIRLQDTTRIYKPHTTINDALHFRPIEVDLWYPSNQKTATSMTFGDLFRLLEERAVEYQTDTDYSGITEELASFYVAQLGISGNSEVLLNIRTDSYPDVVPSQEKHPVIIYMAGFNGMGFENYKLPETLAENGYIVLSVSSVGRYPGDMTNQKEDLLEQVYDAEFALNQLVTNNKTFNIDNDRVALLGCSWGGMSAGVFANRNPHIKGFVSLDGTETHYYGETDMNLYADGASGNDNDQYIKDIHDLNLLDPKKQTFKYLYLESGDKLNDFEPTSEYHYYKIIESDKYYLRFTNSSHSDFLCIPSLLSSSTASVLIYDNIELVVLNFFNTLFKGEPDTFQSVWAELNTLPNTTNQPYNLTKRTATLVDNVLHGIVVDKNTAKPLPYVNVGILNQDRGTVTDARGAFSLIMREEFEDDTLRISMIGYSPSEILIQNIDGSKRQTIELTEKVGELQEVIISAEAYKKKRLGNKTKSKFLGTGFGYDQLGAEMGIKINVKNEPTFVEAFNCTITYNRLSATTIFRLNFYALDNGRPAQNILNQNIFVTIDPKQTGSIAIDLAPYDIILNEDVLITLEWVGSEGENQKGEGIYFPLSLLSSGTYFKPSSQARFKKHNGLGVGFSLDVTY